MHHTATPRKPLLRWIVIAGLLMAIPISHLAGQWSRNRALQELMRRATDQVKVHLTYIDSQMDHLHTLTRLVSSDERVIAFFSDPGDAQRRVTINQYLERVMVTTDIVAYLLDSSGEVVASSNWRTPDTFLGSDLAFRPYFKASLKGDLFHYVAVGAVSERLGYFISVPIRLEGRIVGVAVTKTDPQKLILPHHSPETPFLVTEDHGITIISSSDRFLFCHMKPLTTAALERLRRGHQFLNQDIRPLTHQTIDHIQEIPLITLAAGPDIDAFPTSGQFVLAEAVVPDTAWTAYTLWPVHNLNDTQAQSLVITLLALVAALLLTLFTVERWRHMKQMHEQAIRDPLTRLYTRLYMLESASQLLAAHDRHSISGVSAVMLDLDWFKKINDRFGHSAGDSVLVAAANVIHQECRDTDIPIRYGGEEFLIFIPTGDGRQVLQLAERIRGQIKRLELYLDGRRIHLTISGGMAAHQVGEPLEKLIDRADRILYKAKLDGRDRICWEDGESMPSLDPEHLT